MLSFQENEAIETILMFYMFMIWNQIYARQLLLKRTTVVCFISLMNTMMYSMG